METTARRLIQQIFLPFSAFEGEKSHNTISLARLSDISSSVPFTLKNSLIESTL